MTRLAGMALNNRRIVNDSELLRVCGDADIRPWHDRDHGEFGTLRFPAFTATTSVVMKCLSIDGNFDFIGGAQALQRASGKVRGGRG
jgi:hypothetical protein